MAAEEPEVKNINSGDDVIRNFHEMFYKNCKTTYEPCSWMGFYIQKCPFDCWIYQEIVCQTKPDVVIETGTGMGGSAAFLASLFELVGNGRLVSIDIKPEEELVRKLSSSGYRLPAHPRIKYIVGDSVSAEVCDEVTRDINPEDRVMVILDSDHAADHVLKELEIYSKLVTVGNHLIIEDTNILSKEPDISAFIAVRKFLEGNDEFEVDYARERLLLTFNPGGYLRRVK